MKFANLTWGQRGYLLLVAAIIATGLWLNASILVFLPMVVGVPPLATFMLTYLLLWIMGCFRLLFAPTNWRIDGLIDGGLFFICLMVSLITGAFFTEDLLWQLTGEAGLAYLVPILMLILRFVVKTPPFQVKIPRFIQAALLWCAGLTAVVMGGMLFVSLFFDDGQGDYLWEQFVLYAAFWLISIVLAVVVWLAHRKKLTKTAWWLGGCELLAVLLFSLAWLVEGSLALSDAGGVMVFAITLFVGSIIITKE